MEKPELKKSSANINPNKYAGDYLIALSLGAARGDLQLVEYSGSGHAKIYKFKGFFYICPRVNHEPPRQERYNWENIGQSHSRTIYRAV
jgi:hypothetical protein